MVDSTPLFAAGRLRELTTLLRRDGYLFLRRIVPPQKVLPMRQCVCEALDSPDWAQLDTRSEAALTEAPDAAQFAADRVLLESNDPAAAAPLSDAALQRLFASTPLLRARIARKHDTESGGSSATTARCSPSADSLKPGVLLTGYRPVTHDPRVLNVLEGAELRNLFSQLFGQLEFDGAPRAPTDTAVEAAASSPSSASSSAAAAAAKSAPAATFDAKWCRVHGRGENTEEHTDFYRFEHFCSGNSSSNGGNDMFTCWMPLGCLPIHHGTLAVAEGSHLLNGYRQGVYGSGDCSADSELPPDWPRWRDGDASTNMSPGVWRTASFLPGDVVVFDLRLVHASTRNETSHYRLSMDTRWKPARNVTHDMREAFKTLA
jgi:hypothetical protein